jgi:hypothetical protein
MGLRMMSYLLYFIPFPYESYFDTTLEITKIRLNNEGPDMNRIVFSNF